VDFKIYSWEFFTPVEDSAGAGFETGRVAKF